MKQLPLKPYWPFALAGFGCLLLALGINRFAYTPLIPSLIQQGWVTKSGASYIGTIHFLGYLLGAYFGQYAARLIELTKFIKVNLIISIVSLAFSAWYLNDVWFGFWRFMLGLTGAFLMVVTPSAVLRNIPISLHGKVSGFMFSGIGAGIIISGFLLPYFASHYSLSVAWLITAVIGCVFTVIAWQGLKQQPIPTAVIPDEKKGHAKTFLLLNLAYGLFAIGTIPHIVYLVDYVHEQLKLNDIVSGLFWALYGIGAFIGPLCVGVIANKIGIYKSILWSYLIGWVSILLILYNQILFFYLISALMMGFILPTVVSLTSVRVLELYGAKAHPKFWGLTTLSFSFTQVLGTYCMSVLLHSGYDYVNCFVISFVAFLMGLIVAFFAR